MEGEKNQKAPHEDDDEDEDDGAVSPSAHYLPLFPPFSAFWDWLVAFSANRKFCPPPPPPPFLSFLLGERRESILRRTQIKINMPGCLTIYGASARWLTLSLSLSLPSLSFWPCSFPSSSIKRILVSNFQCCEAKKREGAREGRQFQSPLLCLCFSFRFSRSYREKVGGGGGW